MSTLTHRYEPSSRRPATSDLVREPEWRLRDGAVRRLLPRIGTILSSGIVLTPLIAPKTAVYFWRFHF